MKTNYWLPSGDYNIVLTKEELAKLIETGSLQITTGRTECTAGRYYFNGEDLVPAWKTDVFNCLLMYLDEEDVGKEDAGEHYVQFLNIRVEME